MSRLSIRARLAFTFAGSLLLVLILAAVFVYFRVDDSLTSALDDRLEIQLAELATVAASGDSATDSVLPGPTDPEDGFSQVLETDGSVVASNVDGGASVLGPAELELATAGATEVEELPVAGVDGEARIVAAPVSGPDGELVVVAGVSTDDRAEALAGIAGAFAIGAPIAVLLAAGLGYLLAARSLAPVEAIRRRAGEITLARSGERLPLPKADDEIRRLAETLNSMLDRIEGSLEREREFVADASHELRTPLAILRAELELAERPGRSPEEMRGAFRSAAEETDRLSRLADDLLLIARSEDGRLPIKPQETELAPLLQVVGDRFTDGARDDGREIRVDVAVGLFASVDPMRIEQAVGNLITNSLVHGAGTITVSARPEGDHIEIDVGDEGPGFPEGFGNRAFDRFTRADDARTGGGAGLGLAIVRGIAEAHGGSATVVGTGPGSTVRIELPASHRHLIDAP